MHLERLPPDLQSSLSTRFGLTPAEAEIALALGDGATLAEIAGLRATSIHTVRNQVKALLAKAGVHRQLDLIRVIEGARRPV